MQYSSNVPSELAKPRAQKKIAEPSAAKEQAGVSPSGGDLSSGALSSSWLFLFSEWGGT